MTRFVIGVIVMIFIVFCAVSGMPVGERIKGRVGWDPVKNRMLVVGVISSQENS